jgi:hypothetical protein
MVFFLVMFCNSCKPDLAGRRTDFQLSGEGGWAGNRQAGTACGHGIKLRINFDLKFMTLIFQSKKPGWNFVKIDDYRKRGSEN